MASISIVEYIHELKQAGFTDKQAEVQARKIESICSAVKHDIKQEIKHDIKNQNLATKNDILMVKNDIAMVRNELKNDIAVVRTELKDTELRLIKWVIATGFIIVGSTIGALLTVVKLFVH